MSDEDIKIDPQTIATIDALERVTENRAVTNEAEEQDAVRITQQAKLKINELEAQRKKHVDPLNKRVKQINNLFKTYTSRLLKLEQRLKGLIVASVQRREAANRVAIQAATHNAVHGGEVGRHLDAIDDRPLPPSTSLSRYWGYQIIEPTLIPLQFWSPDPAKIAAHLAQHTDFDNPPTIAGVEITIQGSLTVRTR